MNKELPIYVLSGAFRKQYFPTFMAGIYAGCASLASMLVIVLTTYLRNVSLSDAALPTYMTVFLLCVFFSLCNILIIRGRPRWVWGAVWVFILCFLTTLPAIAFQPHRFIYLLGVCAPLLGLFILNTRRHREMRQEYVRIRLWREEVTPYWQALHRRESKRRTLRLRRQYKRIRQFILGKPG